MTLSSLALVCPYIVLIVLCPSQNILLLPHDSISKCVYGQIDKLMCVYWIQKVSATKNKQFKKPNIK